MLAMTVGVVVFLLTCIVPKFETMLRGKVLPTPTRLLLASGELLRHHGHWLAIAVGIVVAGVVWYCRTPHGRIMLDTVLLHLPGVAGLYRTGALARCSRTLGLLLQAGVPMHQALDHTQEVAGSHAFRRLWQRAQNNVVNGGAVLDALRGQDLCGPGFEQLVAAGEATATLDKVLQKVAAQQTKDLERRIKDLLTVLEPMLVLAMAAIVGFVALAIMMPIFRMSRGG
jgi:type II secretory pathway component PulF